MEGKSYELRIKFIEGKNIYLRPVLKSDFPEMLIWMNDKEVLLGLTMFEPMSEKKEMEWIENGTPGGNTITLAIVLKDGTLIGTVGFHAINWKNRTGVSGCCIRKEYWGKGYGPEAKMLMLRYAFYDLNLRKIISEVYGSNQRSIRMQEKCGGVLEGILKEHIYIDGQYVDQFVFGFFKKDYKNISLLS